MKKNYQHVLYVKRGWTKLPNAIRHDENLTSDAKVVLYELLSVSGEFHIYESGIASSLNLSLERVKKAISLLKSTGYIKLDKIKKGSQFCGCEWFISDTSGTFRKSENRATGNRATGNADYPNEISDSRKTERPETERREILSNENPSIYEYTDRYEQPKDELTENELTELGEVRERTTTTPTSPSTTAEQNPEGRVVVVADFAPSPNKGDLSGENSSGAEAPSLGDKNTRGGQVISPLEFKFQEFLKKYPKAPLSRELEETRKAFFDAIALDGNFEMIMAGLDEWCDSPEWTRDEGRWIKKPLNFIKERQWEKRSRPRSFLEQMQEVLPDEEDDFFNGIN